MLKIENCCEEDRAPPTAQKSENKFRVIWFSMRKDSHCMSYRFENTKNPMSEWRQKSHFGSNSIPIKNWNLDYPIMNDREWFS